uniref:Uncharacterized protein n=1 Tax=Arundo donax TaxID=35708 RepID=A0A0A9BPF8_ARUDO
MNVMSFCAITLGTLDNVLACWSFFLSVSSWTLWCLRIVGRVVSRFYETGVPHSICKDGNSSKNYVLMFALYKAKTSLQSK